MEENDIWRIKEESWIFISYNSSMWKTYELYNLKTKNVV